VVAAFSDTLPSLRLLREDRRGKAYALNRGIAAARGERLVLLDHDDAIAGGYPEAMENALRHFDLVGARVAGPSGYEELSAGSASSGKYRATACAHAVEAASGEMPTSISMGAKGRFDPNRVE
jgi:glycosyltransferase involved in cell wall biosynthesis